MVNPNLKTRSDYHDHSWENLIDPPFRIHRWYWMSLFCLIGGFLLGLTYGKLTNPRAASDQFAASTVDPKLATNVNAKGAKQSSKA